MTTRPSQFIKTDEIHLDTSKTPWMEFAKAELEKKVHEIAADDDFVNSLRTALTVDTRMQNLERQIGDMGKGSYLLDGRGASTNTGSYKLVSKQLRSPVPALLGSMEANRLRERNPEINKYFDGLMTDPAYGKGRSSAIGSTHVSSSGAAQITAWCAAFVNWCLNKAGVPHLGYATARSWLEFGTPVAHPVYGCIVVIKPSSSTGSTTGHVAFYVSHQGNRVKLLGGNQVNGTRVSETTYPDGWVLGYRWPTKINHYLTAGSGVLA